MRSRTIRKWVVTILAAAVLVIAGWLIFGHKKPAPAASTNKTTSSQPAPSGSTTTAQKYIETSDFKYTIPDGWIGLDSAALIKTGADSGIGRISGFASTFSTKLSSAVPKNDTDLKNNTLADIQKNAPNFKLLSSTATKIDDKSGQSFIYFFTDGSGQSKYRQQLVVIPYKDKTFFLLVSSTDGDFDKQAGDFKAIFDSFKFK